MKSTGPKNEWKHLNEEATKFYEQGDYSGATVVIKELLELVEQFLGEDHPHVATALNNLALLNHAQGKQKEAELIYIRSLKIKAETLGIKHPSVITGMLNLVCLYRAMGYNESVELLSERLLAITERANSELDDLHGDVVDIFNEAKHQSGYEVRKGDVIDWSQDFDDRDPDDWESHYAKNWVIRRPELVDCADGADPEEGHVQARRHQIPNWEVFYIPWWESEQYNA